MKPALRLDEPDILDASQELLMEKFKMQIAPPNADPPVALVSPNFRQNVQRLLVLVPSRGAPFGSWDTDLPNGRGATVPILQWAEANNYAVAIFSSAALEAAPAEAWDRIVSGTPARHVVILAAARGSLDLLHAALEPVHELLFARFHMVAMPWEGVTPASASPSLASSLPKPKALRLHLRAVQMHWPLEWLELEPRLMRQRIFEMFKEKEDVWQAQEANKMMNIRSLKENDIPGLRRVPVDERVARINRDRNTDELSRLCQTNSRQGKGKEEDDEEEPGVD